MNEVEIRDAAFKVATAYVQKKGIKAGLTGKQHAGVLTAWAIDAKEMTPVEMWVGFLELANGSALRQKLEKAKVLTKDVTAIEADYTP